MGNGTATNANDDPNLIALSSILPVLFSSLSLSYSLYCVYWLHTKSILKFKTNKLSFWASYLNIFNQILFLSACSLNIWSTGSVYKGYQDDNTETIPFIAANIADFAIVGEGFLALLISLINTQTLQSFSVLDQTNLTKVRIRRLRIFLVVAFAILSTPTLVYQIYWMATKDNPTIMSYCSYIGAILYDVIYASYDNLQLFYLSRVVKQWSQRNKGKESKFIIEKYRRALMFGSLAVLVDWLGILSVLIVILDFPIPMNDSLTIFSAIIIGFHSTFATFSLNEVVSLALGEKKVELIDNAKKRGNTENTKRLPGERTGGTSGIRSGDAKLIRGEATIADVVEVIDYVATVPM